MPTLKEVIKLQYIRVDTVFPLKRCLGMLSGLVLKHSHASPTGRVARALFSSKPHSLAIAFNYDIGLHVLYISDTLSRLWLILFSFYLSSGPAPSLG